jgi:hypothetical protein
MDIEQSHSPTSTQRVNAHRARTREGIVLLTLKFNLAQLVNRLVVTGNLDPIFRDDRARLLSAMQAVADDWLDEED